MAWATLLSLAAISLFVVTAVAQDFKPDDWAYQPARITDRKWKVGKATFYGDNMLTQGTGNCGYPKEFVFSRNQLAVPDPRWTDTKTPGFPNFKGAACGQCFQILCLPRSRYAGKVFCRKGYINATITNYDRPGDEDWAINHFDLYKDGFAKIAEPSAGEINVVWRRVPCDRSMKPKYSRTGNNYWHDIVVYNVPGSGTVLDVEVRCAGESQWRKADHGWGAHRWLNGKCDFSNSATKVRALVGETKRYIFPSPDFR